MLFITIHRTEPCGCETVIRQDSKEILSIEQICQKHLVEIQKLFYNGKEEKIKK